ncbi:hypothetical protein A2960_05855 [Candidatus Gottesmanbacteria bacterium RIFCSPLOWO2_01_FULL_39_12b]|uniref:HMA domain-containing protein n=1 Tax=Candidatus Gottesmanbacteria bacterium RIFCSPLOWO2_01_FULL_39_12b TaxID=1798388 RepID=A0A1F6AMX2_9BACT|nr:MAG: hypothetical protein A2960_05855 [Candidatus Gottesmanbacteria bacterium RIFCSPLOWO2_01_FULL_39_12b]
MIKKAIFKIEGIHCTACVLNIDGQLEDTTGITEASTHYAKQETTVVFEKETITPQEICEIIKKLGYGASLISSN